MERLGGAFGGDREGGGFGGGSGGALERLGGAFGGGGGARHEGPQGVGNGQAACFPALVIQGNGEVPVIGFGDGDGLGA